MKHTGKQILTLLTLLTLALAVRAQEAPNRDTSKAAAPAVTVSITEHGVRFAALGAFGKLRLEVFNADGGSVYSSDFSAASVRDWGLADKSGQRVADGTYLCVITTRDMSGRLSTRQGSVVLQGGQAALKLPDAELAETVEPDKSLAPVTDPANTALTFLGHDGNNGQLVTTRGGLSFRAGDFFRGKDREQMRLTEEGNLGIGTSTPQTTLDVAGVIRAQQGLVFGDGSTLNVNEQGALTLSNSERKSSVTLSSTSGSITPSLAGTGTQNQLAKWTDNAGTLGNSTVTETGGFVGLGTINPASLLHLAGAAGVSAITLNSPGNQRFRFQTVPNVQNWGALTLNGNYNNGWFLDDTTINGYFFKLDTRGGNVGGNNNGLWLYRIPPGPNPHVDESPIFGVSNGLAYFTGNVGIGTITPQSLLDVNGNLNVSGNAVVAGNIAAKYQDIAEWTAARSQLAAGTVVTLDPLKANSVMASHKAYDTGVAGVVSPHPGVLLGERGRDKILVATTGRVRVRVDATRAPIHIGDLLVASNIPGVAMKSQGLRLHGRIMHRPGTIIGKALEPLERGQGTILVLLSLQ